MYFLTPEELNNIVPVDKGIWNKEYLYEWLVWSCNSRFKNHINKFFEKYTDNEELAELLFSFLLDDDYDGSDCQMGSAFYISKLKRELLIKKKDLLLLAQENEVYWKRPFQTDEYLEWLNLGNVEDNRIQSIMKKMEKLSEKHPKYTCGKFPPKWGEALTEQDVEKFESEQGIVLPNDYRRFITTVAASCTQPFYGLCSPLRIVPDRQIMADLKAKFPYTVRRPLNVYELTDDAYEALYERNEPNVDAGYILLCHEGCGMYSILIVNTEDEETYGTVWYYDLCNDAGIYPLINPVTKKTMNFLDWIEYYVDKTLELDDDDYFGYAELTGVLE